MLEQILQSATNQIKTIKNLQEWRSAKAKYLGKSSELNKAMQNITSASADKKKALGQKLNTAKKTLQALLDDQLIYIKKLELNKLLENEWIDLTLPARDSFQGGIHPITQCLEELIQVFSKYGFNIKDGPSIEDDWHNFTALNIGPDHPARQMQDTFYLNKTNEKSKLLRTHTSPIQIRTMKQEKPPYRFIAPGRTYRSDSDLTHTPMFHQIEGLVIDKDIHMGHLKYIIIDFIKTFFEQPNIKIQFRPSFFPFTEPSAEVDITIGKSTEWLEVLGCGMVHPNVLKNVGIDPEIYQGFAFGIGIERFAMLKYNINDLRQFFSNDIRWLRHYNFSSFDIPTLAGGLTK